MTKLEHIFALAGATPPATGTVARARLEACPAQNLPRAVAWYLLSRDPLSHQRIAEGLLYIASGWGDYFVVSRVTRGAPVPGLPRVGAGLAVRPAQSGKWSRSAVLREDGVRPRVELGAAWLAAVAARVCTEHDDCAACAELGEACAAGRAA